MPTEIKRRWFSDNYFDLIVYQAIKIKPDWEKPLPVLVQINGKPDSPWHINMMPAGEGHFYLYPHGAVRGTSHTGVGDKVDVKIRFDSDYKSGPQHPMQHWFSAALDKNPNAKKSWEELIPSRKEDILRYFAALKSQGAKDRNRARALDVLSGEKDLTLYVKFMEKWRLGARKSSREYHRAYIQDTTGRLHFC